jgi:hypothetical protein
MNRILAAILGILLFSGPAPALEPEATGAPAQLRPWTDWVLYGHQEARLCPPDHARRRLCAWPVSLALDLGDRGGRFLAVFDLKREMAFTLPGESGAWPRDVKRADGTPVMVLGRDRPQVFLPPGRHTLTGEFQWLRLPETIRLPLGSALSLKVNGQAVDFPPLEADYQSNSVRLWLGAAPQEEDSPALAATAADRLAVTVNRLIRDEQPLQIGTRLKLVVSGREREVVLSQALLPGTRASFLSSPLPAQLADGGLRVRVKPGVFDIFLDSRAEDRPQSLGPAPGGEEEYWAFQARPELRLAEVSGAEQIDPSQVDFHPPWQSFPIYVLPPGGSLTFTTLRQGDPDPPPDQLRLNRECWLDYDGEGLSCRDHLSGVLNRQWHLNTTEPFSLAQASLSGQPQVITWQTDSRGGQAPGLQLREGRINLEADLRLDGFSGRLPASGWDHALETEGQKLNLPPGYHLFHVSGAEARQNYPASGSGTWTGAWGTLDFFLVLLISIASARLYGPAAGLLGLAALTLGYHEPLAPRLVFIHLLITAALLKHLPAAARKARGLVRLWRLSAALVLVVLASLFIINQARVTLHPQLEDPGYWPGREYSGFAGFGASSKRSQDYYYADRYDDGPADYDQVAMAEAPVAEEMAAMREEMRGEMMRGMGERPPAPPKALMMDRAKSSATLAAGAALGLPAQAGNQMVRLSQAPDAKVQNSLPRPAWNWRSVRLYYNETVSADQQVRLLIYGPTAWRLLGGLRLVLMALFALRLLEVKIRPNLRNLLRPASAAGLILAGLWASPALAESWPDPALLEDYRARLLEQKPLPPAGLPHLRLGLAAEGLELDLTVEAGREEVIPLPALDRNIFRPSRLTLDNGRELPLFEIQDRWLTLVPPGRHLLKLAGRLKKTSPAFQSFDLSFPPEGRPERVEVSGEGWQVEGLEPDGRLRGRTLLLRSLIQLPETQGEEAVEAEGGLTLSPFFQVQRVLSLGLDWRISTVVRRLTPTGAPVSLNLPLLPGENPVSGVITENGRVTVSFGPQEDLVTWESSLSPAPTLTLTAEDGPFSESWALDASPIWRVEPRGLVPIHHTQGGFWQPQWRPWPGESLRLEVGRPRPVPGLYLVADRGDLTMTLGETRQLADLNFRVRASQGGPFTFSLPDGVEVREFTVDGRSVPLGLTAGDTRGSTLTAPLSAGPHEIKVAWSREAPLGAVSETPALDLGLPTANVTTTLVLPQNRWILWTWGPLEGPAVLFWSILAVTLLASLGLARLKLTPLGWGSWFLLSWGLIQFHLLAALIVAGWLLVLGRRRQAAAPGAFFNPAQVGLVLWTILALYLLYRGVENGLLRNPDMIISGGGSYGRRLTWFTDRLEGSWPQGRVWSVSLWYYKALMLAWSLWLAASLVGWLRWAWTAFSTDGFWRSVRPDTKKPSDEGLHDGKSD